MNQIATQIKQPDLKVLEGASRKQLKVLLLNYEFPPSGGGAGNATYHTALELGRRGHHVDVLTARLPNQPDVDTEGKMTVHRVYSHRLSVHESGLFGAATYLVMALRRLRYLARSNNYDLYHFYFGLPTGILSLYVHLVLKKPYIISLRGSDVPGYDNTRWYLQPLHLFLRPLSRYLWTRAASVVALSRHLRDLAKLTAPNLEIGVIGNAVDNELFPSKPSARPADPLRLVCVCRLIKRKGIDYLVEAMRALDEDDISLEIVGTGDLQKEVETMVQESGVAHRITLTGYVPRECLAERYHAADVFILPSLSESFGQVLLEAMSCGLPIVASRVGGIPETIEHGVNGLLVQPGNARSLVAAVRRLAADPELVKKLGEVNAARARSHYNWGVIADRYEDVYFDSIGTDDSVESRRV